MGIKKKEKVTAESYFLLQLHLLQLHMLLCLACRASFNRDLHQKLDAFTAQGGEGKLGWGSCWCVFVCVWRVGLGGRGGRHKMDSSRTHTGGICGKSKALKAQLCIVVTNLSDDF